MADGTLSGLPFLKMHGAGNDFVIVDSRGASARISSPIARAIGDRHRGVGYDQLAEIRDDATADIALDFWNSDGSRAGACGNATRCVADLVLRETGQERLSIRTDRGLLWAEQRDGGVWVNMRQPQTGWDEIPLALEVDTLALPLEGAPTGVGMGNPHAIHFVDNAETAPLTVQGPQVENDPLFPERTNVEFVSITGADHLRMRVWERGTGVTLACGSGACATVVAAHLKGLTSRAATVDVDGGTLLVDWRDDGVWLSGPVAHVFRGTLSPTLLATV